MNLYKSDLKKIGHTAYGMNSWPNHHNETEYLHIICDGRTANIEEILLREVLALFGDYKIVETFDTEGVFEMCDVEIVTDFPWEEYQKL